VSSLEPFLDKKDFEAIKDSINNKKDFSEKLLTKNLTMELPKIVDFLKSVYNLVQQNQSYFLKITEKLQSLYAKKKISSKNSMDLSLVEFVKVDTNEILKIYQQNFLNEFLMYLSENTIVRNVTFKQQQSCKKLILFFF
jgi:hypothetical protein